VNHAIKQEDRAFSGKRGKTPGTQVQQSRIPDGQMTAFRHCCVGESRIDPWAVRDCPRFFPSYNLDLHSQAENALV
jgi:hypothetical protein